VDKFIGYISRNQRLTLLNLRIDHKRLRSTYVVAIYAYLK